MLDFSHLPVSTGASDVQVFTGNSVIAGGEWQTWVKPRGKTMLNIVLFGKGGNGGTGVVGAVNTAAGGGGGGSGGQTSLTIPLALLPDRLFLSLAGQSSTTTLASYIAIVTDTTPNNTVAYAAGGGNGGNGAGATAGAAGAGGLAATAGIMPLGWAFTKLVLAGQAGIGGGTIVASAALIPPTTGLLITGGTGGSGLPGTGLAGFAAGAFTVQGFFSENPQPGGTGGTAATTPPGRGSAGRIVIPPYGYMYGGTGGGSTFGSATGAGLVQAAGGDGAWGCGGGGMGGALTASTAAVFSKGGPALAILTCW